MSMLLSHSGALWFWQLALSQEWAVSVLMSRWFLCVVYSFAHAPIHVCTRRLLLLVYNNYIQDLDLDLVSGCRMSTASL